MEKNQKEIYLAGGCFWGVEHYFKQFEGIVSTQVGYANGTTENPTYEQVCTDKTGFAETVRIVYNPQQIPLDELLKRFFDIIDPTSLNQQGEDKGSQYRTGIYFTDPTDLSIIEKAWQEEQQNHSQTMVVEKLPLQNFYPAEAYHQHYLDKNPNGYCHIPRSFFKK